MSALAMTPAANAASAIITGVISQTVGTTAEITVGTSGSKDNTNTWAEGQVGTFAMDIGGATKYMTVEATVPTGSLSAGTDSLMVAQTVASQGLTDEATLSIYVSPSSNTEWTLDVRFRFWNDEAATSAYEITTGAGGFMLTSLDIDYAQRYYTSDTSFTSNFTYGTTSITSAPALAGYSGFTAVPNAQYDDPAAAVSSRGVGSEFDIKLAHNAVALFMFEFRDPSNIVPEPSTPLLGGLASLLLLRRRRVSMKSAIM